jgi:murein DD-endopeptidase MepM/ murein hydrolase activator NlpD
MTVAVAARALGSALFMVALAGSGAALAGPLDGAASSVTATSSALATVGTVSTAEMASEGQMRAAFNSWKNADAPVAFQPVIAIPSVHPVDKLDFTSNFGIRSDPFNHTARMHAGVDIPGPVGTPVYATADGTVDRAERAGGYGNLVELDHGKGIQTRYGHLSSILVHDGEHVHRGQMIALMGSTGRSTGPHLHYEVRMDGKAVNPAPFLTAVDFLTASQSSAVNLVPVSTSGPAPQD